jgi:hypothetical protein
MSLAPLPLHRAPGVGTVGHVFYEASAQRPFTLVRLIVVPHVDATWSGPLWLGKRPRRRRAMLRDMWSRWLRIEQLRALRGVGLDRLHFSRQWTGTDWESLLAVDGGAPIGLEHFLGGVIPCELTSPLAKRLRAVVVGQRTELGLVAIVDIAEEGEVVLLREGSPGSGRFG